MKTMRLAFVGRYSIVLTDEDCRSLRVGVSPCPWCLLPLNVVKMSMATLCPARLGGAGIAGHSPSGGHTPHGPLKRHGPVSCPDPRRGKRCWSWWHGSPPFSIARWGWFCEGLAHAHLVPRALVTCRGLLGCARHSTRSLPATLYDALRCCVSTLASLPRENGPVPLATPPHL